MALFVLPSSKYWAQHPADPPAANENTVIFLVLHEPSVWAKRISGILNTNILIAVYQNFFGIHRVR